MTTIEQLLYELDCLSPQEICDLMVKEGIKGVKCHSKACPLSIYLNLKFPSIRGHIVDSEEVTVGSETYKLPISPKCFVELFDNGEFPELEA